MVTAIEYGGHKIQGLLPSLAGLLVDSVCWVEIGWVGAHMDGSKAREYSLKPYKQVFLYSERAIQPPCKSYIMKVCDTLF